MRDSKIKNMDSRSIDKAQNRLRGNDSGGAEMESKKPNPPFVPLFQRGRRADRAARRIEVGITNHTVCQGSVSVLAGASPDWVKVSHQPSTDSHMLVR